MANKTEEKVGIDEYKVYVTGGHKRDLVKHFVYYDHNACQVMTVDLITRSGHERRTFTQQQCAHAVAWLLKHNIPFRLFRLEKIPEEEVLETLGLS